VLKRCDCFLTRSARFFAIDMSKLHKSFPQDSVCFEEICGAGTMDCGDVCELRNPMLGKLSAATVVPPSRLGMGDRTDVQILVLPWRSCQVRSACSPPGYVAVTNRHGLPIGRQMCALDPRHPDVVVQHYTVFPWVQDVQAQVDAVVSGLQARRTAVPSLVEEFVGPSDVPAVKDFREALWRFTRTLRRVFDEGLDCLGDGEKAAFLAHFSDAVGLSLPKTREDCMRQDRERGIRGAMKEALSTIMSAPVCTNAPKLIIAQTMAFLRSAVCPLEINQRADQEERDFFEKQRPSMETVWQLLDSDDLWESFCSSAYPSAVVSGGGKVPIQWLA